METLTSAQLRDILYMTLRCKIGMLPQLKGKGREVNPSVVDRAVGQLADHLVETFRLCQYTVTAPIDPHQYRPPQK